MMRNAHLLHEIADVMEFWPERYEQATWGRLTPDDAAIARFEENLGRAPRMENYDHSVGVGWSEDAGFIHADVDCGTVMCVAGHACALSGWFPTIYGRANGMDEVRWSSVSRVKDTMAYGPGVARDVAIVAQEELGLTDEEAEILFKSHNEWTVEELRAFADGADIETWNGDDDDE
tara:strand:+ start:265 stop:792 length:528 start_codon:yes stop_codon:yes gene_type:complete